MPAELQSVSTLPKTSRAAPHFSFFLSHGSYYFAFSDLL